jgi:S1-C subfamily serine protease
MRRRFLQAFVPAVLVTTALVIGLSTAFGGTSRTVASAASVKTGVVVVTSRLAYSTGGATGTGIVLSSSGEVLTNNHVIRGASAIRVTDVSTGRTYSATVVGYSVSKDIAVLKLSNTHGLRTAVTGNSASVRVGNTVTAVGNAGGTGVLTTKSGRVTGLNRAITVNDEAGGMIRLTGLIETSAPLQPGDSGGPLLSNGRVVGIDAAASSNFTFHGVTGEGYAIPINTALKIARQIEAGQRSATVHIGPTAFLGVSVGQAGYGQDAQGALVEGVASGSPAARAGLNANDVITRFAGSRVLSPAKLRSLILRFSPGATVRVTWINPYTGTTTASVRLASGPAQ